MKRRLSAFAALLLFVGLASAAVRAEPAHSPPWIDPGASMLPRARAASGSPRRSAAAHGALGLGAPARRGPPRHPPAHLRGPPRRRLPRIVPRGRRLRVGLRRRRRARRSPPIDAARRPRRQPRRPPLSLLLRRPRRLLRLRPARVGRGRHAGHGARARLRGRRHRRAHPRRAPLRPHQPQPLGPDARPRPRARLRLPGRDAPARRHLDPLAWVVNDHARVLSKPSALALTSATKARFEVVPILEEAESNLRKFYRIGDNA